MLAQLRQPPVSLDDSFFTTDDLAKSLKSSPFFLAGTTQASPPSPADTIDTSPQHYVAPSPQYPAQALSRVSSGISDDYMTDQFDFSNPAIRIQQSTPTPQPSFTYPQHSVLVDGAQNTTNWLFGGGSAHMPAASSMQTLASNNRHRSTHRREPSTSSAGSNSPASPFNQGPTPQFTYPNHLPTPTHTPTQDSYIPSSFQPSFNDLNSAVTAHMAMRHALADANSVAGDDAPDFSHSTRHSVSSFGRNSPATPRTVNGDDFDEGFRVPSNDNVVRSTAQVPKLERSMTDMYSDEGFNPMSQPPTSQRPKALTLLSPYHNAMMNERLQQANQARSQSPTSAGMRSISPFRATSRYADSTHAFRSVQQARATQQANAEASALAQQGMRSRQDSEPKTISPKDAVLEYNESEDDAKMPSLFPDEESSSFATFPAGGFQNAVPATSGGFGGLAVSNGWTSPIGSSASSFTPTSAATAQQPPFPFAPSSVPGAFHGLASNNTNFSSGNSSMHAHSEETPEFPAHLTSMESSASEAPPQSSSNSHHADIAAKPSSALADTGTYTCTYHGCTQRFETPQKLQRHKREAHRQNVQQQTASQRHTPGVGSGLTSQALLERNSQAGPHKCERINPTTGKPCNTIFSRPYDLTRHEDTIHNARKQKVRCALCQEEKTFSRNDALTRHMRVVHPDVDFPGKHRRRGGRSDD